MFLRRIWSTTWVYRKLGHHEAVNKKRESICDACSFSCSHTSKIRENSSNHIPGANVLVTDRRRDSPRIEQGPYYRAFMDNLKFKNHHKINIWKEFFFLRENTAFNRELYKYLKNITLSQKLYIKNAPGIEIENWLLIFTYDRMRKSGCVINFTYFFK